VLYCGVVLMDRLENRRGMWRIFLWGVGLMKGNSSEFGSALSRIT
jgi:hypothetical protein